jgi:hypothetical protein
MKKKDRHNESINHEDKLKNTLSYKDYLTYKKNDSNINAITDQDEIIGTYDSHKEGKELLDKNMTGGGKDRGRKKVDKYITINGEKIILKIGKDQNYLTKDGNLISVKKYKDKNNYVDLLTMDREPVIIKVKNKKYYIQKNGDLFEASK